MTISASGHARTVRERTLPLAPLINANLAMLSPFAVSMITKRSDSPEVKKHLLDLDPELLSPLACGLDTLWGLLDRADTLIGPVQRDNECQRCCLLS